MDPTQSYTANTPSAALRRGEQVTTQFHPDRATYWRTNAWMAAIAMAIGMAILWLIGNPHVWTGAVGGLFAIAVRAFYLASDELKQHWDLTNQRLLGPGGREVELGQIAEVRTILGMVQIITQAGDKHLIKNQAAPEQAIAQIEAARGDLISGGGTDRDTP
ncbi:hypothetical protein [Gymnodinialimonas phycosphaerae]|nr:hypothetical protein [Gymnodinialimonas phycosphaerae]